MPRMWPVACAVRSLVPVVRIAPLRGRTESGPLSGFVGKPARQSPSAAPRDLYRVVAGTNTETSTETLV